MKKKFGKNLSQIGALYDFYGQKDLGRQSSGIELSTILLSYSMSLSLSSLIGMYYTAFEIFREMYKHMLFV